MSEMLIPKDNALRSKTHREFVAKLCCIKCHVHPCVAAHFRLGTGGGTSYKPSDIYTVPLCHDHHNEQHGGERTFYRDLLRHIGEDDIIDHVKNFCRHLYAATGNTVEGFKLARSFRHGIR